MRVVIASRIFAPEPAAASFRLTALAQALHDQGADVTVLTTTVPGAASHPIDRTVDVRRAPVLRDDAGYVRGYLQYLSFDVPLLFRLLSLTRPDVVVVEPPPTTGAIVRLVCGIRRIPYVYYAADIWSDAAVTAAPKLIVRAVRAVEGWAIRGAAAVLSVTDGVTLRVGELGARNDVATVGNGVDTSTFSLDGPTAELAGRYLLYAGTASEVQGAAVFVEAFGRLLEDRPDVCLVFLGHGSDWKRLQEAAQTLPPGSVRFLPRAPAAVAAEWLRGATATLASIRPGEGYDFARPTKILASAACGTPVIFAGPVAAGALVADAGLGFAVGYDVTEVYGAMRTAVTAPASASRRASIAAWATDNASIRAVADRASRSVIGVGSR